MARRFQGELAAADDLARRFVRAQTSEERKLGYPRMAAFAKDIARGTVSLAPTPEDPDVELVGRFLWGRPEIERRVILGHYDHDEGFTCDVKAHRLGMSRRRYNRVLERVLLMLAGYVSGSQEAA